MRFKFWDRPQRQPEPDHSETDAALDPTLAAARRRLAEAEELNDAADALMKRSDHSLAVNGFGTMIDRLYGEHPRRNP
ncbi:DUF7620 family protein [Kineococcus radiotolerans]|uniref:DUF7620 family protein n=1 Tax=Kineococcus radiotolerans TaxID=131568 RepID=UPI00059E6A72